MNDAWQEYPGYAADNKKPKRPVVPEPAETGAFVLVGAVIIYLLVRRFLFPLRKAS